MTSSSLLSDGVGELIDLSLASSECSKTALSHPACLLVLAISVWQMKKASGIMNQQEISLQLLKVLSARAADEELLLLLFIRPPGVSYRSCSAKLELASQAGPCDSRVE